VQQNKIEFNLEHEMRELREHGMSRLEKEFQTAKQQANFIANAFDEYCYNIVLGPSKAIVKLGNISSSLIKRSLKILRF
jgi:hypothetical protein